jgi:tRNA pseudouridine38-40 synthase
MQHSIRLTLEYDGTDFKGWQIQPDQRTVQGELQTRLQRLYGAPISVIASGRTDAGVHALGQVVNFVPTREISLERLQISLNGMLPPDIAVKNADYVAPDFHARFDARRRHYFYRMCANKHPMGRYYAWHMRRPLDLDTLKQASSILLGRHDFTSFCVTAYEKDNRVCELYRCEWCQQGEELTFHIEGNRFLRAMVRSIVGTLVEMGRGVRPAEAMHDILGARNRQSAGESAPARGLFLERVIYDDELPQG